VGDFSFLTNGPHIGLQPRWGCEEQEEEVIQMHLKKFMVVGTAALAVLGSVTGAALASSRGAKAPAKPASSVTQTTDAATSVTASAKSASVKSSNSKAGANPSESGSEGSGESESSGESDGPGGHEDPPGDVNHEFDGEE
jgi:hypothetical protein